MKLSNALKVAVNGLYVAFEEVPIPDTIEGCPCCIDEKEIDTLLATPPKELSQDSLAHYATSAFLTVGDVADYLYFLPRIVEISIKEEYWWPDIEITARAIKDSGYESWPEFRRNALTAVFQAYLDNIIETELYYDIDSLMCAIARIEIDVKPYLSVIEKDPKAVIAYWEENAATLNEGKLANAFWDPPNHGHDEIVRWFRSDNISSIYAEQMGRRM